MATSKSLRVVEPGEKPAPKRKLTISEAAAASDRELLVALRERVAKAVDDPNCPARDLAALTRRLQEITKDIAAIDAREEEASAHAEVVDGTFDASAI